MEEKQIYYGERSHGAVITDIRVDGRCVTAHLLDRDMGSCVYEWSYYPFREGYEISEKQLPSNLSKDGYHRKIETNTRSSEEARDALIKHIVKFHLFRSEARFPFNRKIVRQALRKSLE